jgi:head-tail adaptor
MISDFERDALMDLVEGLWVDTADIKRRTVTQTEDGYAETWAFIETVPCMVVTTPTQRIVESADAAVDVNAIRVLVRRDVDVRPGDRLTVNGRDFLVVDTSYEAGHRIYQACNCRVVE